MTEYHSVGGREPLINTNTCCILIYKYKEYKKSFRVPFQIFKMTHNARATRRKRVLEEKKHDPERTGDVEGVVPDLLSTMQL